MDDAELGRQLTDELLNDPAHSLSPCQRCKSERVLSAYAKHAYPTYSLLNGEEWDSDTQQAPDGLPFQRGDNIEFRLCLDCGQMQGPWPLPRTEIEMSEEERVETKDAFPWGREEFWGVALDHMSGVGQRPESGRVRLEKDGTEVECMCLLRSGIRAGDRVKVTEMPLKGMVCVVPQRMKGLHDVIVGEALEAVPVKGVGRFRLVRWRNCEAGEPPVAVDGSQEGSAVNLTEWPVKAGDWISLHVWPDAPKDAGLFDRLFVGGWVMSDEEVAAFKRRRFRIRFDAPRISGYDGTKPGKVLLTVKTRPAITVKTRFHHLPVQAVVESLRRRAWTSAEAVHQKCQERRFLPFEDVAAILTDLKNAKLVEEEEE